MFLLYGIDSIQDDHSFDVFLMRVRTQQIIAEWLKHRGKLMATWEHPSILPYGEALLRNEVPQKELLLELYQKEMKA